MKKIFSISDVEEIVLAENENSVQKLIDVMKNSRGKCLFFITVKNFPFNYLTKEGFAQNKDFLKAWELLSAANGEPFDSHPLVKTL